MSDIHKGLHIPPSAQSTPFPDSDHPVIDKFGYYKGQGHQSYNQNSLSTGSLSITNAWPADISSKSWVFVEVAKLDT